MEKLILLLLTIVTSSGSNVCQNKCICSEEDVDCSSSGLNRVPDTPQQLDLRKLNLSKNLIETITSEDFRDLTNLVSLDISFNSIDYIAEESFSSLKYLKILNMGHNLLYDLPVDVFSKNRFLEELYLNNNNLHVIASLPQSLVRLVLKDSGISEIPPLSLPNLNYIDISNSRMKEISLETQKSLSNVETVYADSNPWKCSAHFERLACWLFYKSNSGARMIRCSSSTGRRFAYFAATLQVQCKKYQSLNEQMRTTAFPYNKSTVSAKYITKSHSSEVPIAYDNSIIKNSENGITKNNNSIKEPTESRETTITPEKVNSDVYNNNKNDGNIPDNIVTNNYDTNINHNNKHTPGNDNIPDNSMSNNYETNINHKHKHTPGTVNIPDNSLNNNYETNIIHNNKHTPRNGKGGNSDNNKENKYTTQIITEKCPDVIAENLPDITAQSIPELSTVNLLEIITENVPDIITENVPTDNISKGNISFIFYFLLAIVMGVFGFIGACLAFKFLRREDGRGMEDKIQQCGIGDKLIQRNGEQPS